MLRHFFNVRPSKQTILLAGRKRKGSPIFLSNSYYEKMGNLYCPCNGRCPTPGTVDLITFFWYFIQVPNLYFDILILYPPIAQLVEQIPLKDKVVGSIPTGRTSEYNS